MKLDGPYRTHVISRTDLERAKHAAHAVWVQADGLILMLGEDTPPEIMSLAQAAKHAAWRTYDAFVLETGSTV